jgi:hypothetical protein
VTAAYTTSRDRRRDVDGGAGAEADVAASMTGKVLVILEAAAETLAALRPGTTIAMLNGTARAPRSLVSTRRPPRLAIRSTHRQGDSTTAAMADRPIAGMALRLKIGTRSRARR